MMREPTAQEARILRARHIDGCDNPQVHDGNWFSGEVREVDTSTEPAVFTLHCYRCKEKHFILEQDVRYLAK
jgi:hypothetical protein